jgi:transposase-like protein
MRTQTLHQWVRKYQIDTAMCDGISSEEQCRINALEHKVRELRLANKILRLASALFAQAELVRRSNPKKLY